MENNTVKNTNGKLYPGGQSAEPHLVQPSEVISQPALALLLQVSGEDFLCPDLLNRLPVNQTNMPLKSWANLEGDIWV